MSEPTEPGVTTVEVHITVVEREDQPGNLNIRVQGPDNLVLLLGILELAKTKITQPKAPDQPRVMPVPGVDLRKLKFHNRG